MKLIWHFKSFEELTTLELYKILQLRTAVFVVEQNCPYQECDDKDLKAKHLWCTLNEEVIAYCRILPQNVSYAETSIGRVVTHPDHRDKKLGHLLMQLALPIIENQFQTTSVRISAQAHLKNFYEKYGFKQVSEPYLEDDIPHIEMLTF